jgi:hypothetical protein
MAEPSKWPSLRLPIYGVRGSVSKAPLSIRPQRAAHIRLFLGFMRAGRKQRYDVEIRKPRGGVEIKKHGTRKPRPRRVFGVGCESECGLGNSLVNGGSFFQAVHDFNRLVNLPVDAGPGRICRKWL